MQHDYLSGLGQFAAGDVVQLVDDLAAHINRDSPGTLESVFEPGPEDDGRTLDAPPHDRMLKGAKKRGENDRRGDPGDQGAMSRAEFKAVKDGE